MIYSGKINEHTKRMGAELNLFWQLSAAVSAIKRRTPRSVCHEEIDELRDELDVLSDMSDWVTLKVAIRNMLVDLDRLSKSLEAVA